MKSISEYIDESVTQQVVRNHNVNHAQKSKHNSSIDDDGKSSNAKSLGLSALKFLTFCGGVALSTVSGVAAGSIGAIVILIALIWGFKDNPYKESLNELLSEEDNINEGIGDMFKDVMKPIVKKILEIDIIKSTVEKIMDMEGYEEIDKNKDKKGLAKLVKSYFSDNEDAAKEIENELKSTKV